MERVGLFGGSFDPVHMAHLMIAERVREARALDRILFIPAGNPPHKPGRPVAPAHHRLEMVSLAIEDNPRFQASSVEIEREGPSYTILTVGELQTAAPAGTQFYFIMGGDMLLDLPSWYRADELVRTVDFIAVERPGHELGDLSALESAFGRTFVRKIKELAVPFPQTDLSSTYVRSLARAGKSLKYLVPESVRRYIEQHGLYREEP